MVDVFLKTKEVSGVVIEECEQPSFICKDILRIKEEFFSGNTLKLADFISKYYVCSVGESLALFSPFVPMDTRRDIESISTDIILSEQQQKAYAFASKNKKSLIFGDTGSGKTEIYIKLIEKQIKQGKRALFLMPEIGLTPQTQKRLIKAFGQKVVIWHSKITKKKKQEILEKIHNKEALIIAGTRSALFLPIDDLGIIIVDEEHDSSYKSDSKPRYNAKDLALYMSANSDIHVVLGSATPSLNSYTNVPYYRLKGRYYNSSLRVVFERDNNKITDNLLTKIAYHLEQKNQIIVFIPTRGNFKYITCNRCNETITCPHCSVSMSLHVSTNSLRCHFCRFATRVPHSCPTCSSNELTSSRIGTAGVVEELKEHFPNTSIKKFDKDEINTANKLEAALKDFNNQKIDILVGTQMLSKGHDYHNVKLCVVLGIDNVLNISEFKSRENAFSLLVQTLGRSGRSCDGEVFIQTTNAEFFNEFLKDYEEFLKDELEYRKGLYPPYRRLIRVLVSHKNEQKASITCSEVAKIAQIFEKKNELEIIGYGKSGVEKIANRYRYDLLARGEKITSVLKFGHMCKNLGANVQVDIDPYHFG